VQFWQYTLTDLNPNVPKKRTDWPVNKKKTAVCRRTKMCPVVKPGPETRKDSKGVTYLLS